MHTEAAREGAGERRGAPAHAEGVGDAMNRVEVVAGTPCTLRACTLALRLVRGELRGDVTKHGGGGAPHPQVLPRAHLWMVCIHTQTVLPRAHL